MTLMKVRRKKTVKKNKHSKNTNYLSSTIPILSHPARILFLSPTGKFKCIECCFPWTAYRDIGLVKLEK